MKNKKELEKTIQKLLKELIIKYNKNNYYGVYKDYTYNLDSKNEYLFISLSSEDLKDINIMNIEKYNDITIIDLQDIIEQPISIFEMIIELLKNIKENGGSKNEN